MSTTKWLLHIKDSYVKLPIQNILQTIKLLLKKIVRNNRTHFITSESSSKAKQFSV